MAQEDSKRYYWLKLRKDFFKQHEIKVIESMPNGKDYILFYLKLLCESTSHEGNLRFSDTIPYNENMLATITDTNVDIVKQAINIFSELNMMTILDDGTYYMAQVEEMIGSETIGAEKKRIYRAKNEKADNVLQLSSNCPQEIEKEIDIEKEIEIDKDIYKKNRFTPPILEEVKAYCLERNNDVNPQKFIDFYESKGWYVGKNKMKDWKAAVRTWEKPKNNTSDERDKIFGG